MAQNLFRITHDNLDIDRFRKYYFTTVNARRYASKRFTHFPNQEPVPCEAPKALAKAFAQPFFQCLRSEDFILILGHENEVLKSHPDLEGLKKIELRGVAVTAPGTDCDFVVSFFAPKYGIDEDPVTGSAFTQLAPYWSKRLGKMELSARQISHRGGNP